MAAMAAEDEVVVGSCLRGAVSRAHFSDRL